MRRFVGEYVAERTESHEPTTDGFEVRCADGQSASSRSGPRRPGRLPDDAEGVVYVAENPQEVRFAGVTVSI